MRRPGVIRGNWADGDWAGMEWEFRETLEFLDDPDLDLDDTLRGVAEFYGHKQQSYSAYLGSEHWLTTRKLALAAAKHRCEKCGSDRKLEVHHRSYAAIGLEHQNLATLQVLCSNCHTQEHQ